MTPGTRADGLRLLTGGAELYSFRVVGALSGVVLLSAAGRNGPGSGLLISRDDGTWLQWQAPGSATPGPVVHCTADSSYLLEDGEDSSKWLRVQVYTTYLAAVPKVARVYIVDRFNALGPDDVSAAEAAAGATETVPFTLKNFSGNLIKNARLWLDPTAPSTLYVSSDNISFYRPISSVDPNVLSWASIANGASVSVWVRRVIGAAATSNPGVLNFLQWKWDGLS